MLFGRIELREARPENVGLPIVSTGGDGTLFNLKVDEPDFRPVILRSIADKDDLEKWFVGFELDRMMELGSEGAQFFEKGNADLFEVLLGAASGSKTFVDGAKVGNIAVEANGLGLGGNLPFRSAKENADVTIIDGGDTRGNGLGFERVINGREENGIIGNVDDGAAAGEVGDDFVFLGAGSHASRERGQQNQDGTDEEVLHGGRVAQRVDCGTATSRAMVSERSRIR